MVSLSTSLVNEVIWSVNDVKLLPLNHEDIFKKRKGHALQVMNETTEIAQSPDTLLFSVKLTFKSVRKI